MKLSPMTPAAGAAAVQGDTVQGAAAPLPAAAAVAAPEVQLGGQAARQLRVIGVEPQAHDMYRGIDKGDRDLHAREVVHAQCLGRRRGTVLAADLVVIGQRPQLHAVAMGARGQCLGRERAVGDDGMAMQVGVEQMRHQGIVGCAPGPRRRSDLRDKAGKNMCLLPSIM